MMLLFAATSLLVVAVDQGVTVAVRRARVPVCERPIWLVRASDLRHGALWLLWIVGAAGVTMTTTLVPANAVWAGLLVGGSFSHALQMSRRGRVIDYVRLSFWPSFNFGDACIAIGTAGVLIHLVGSAWNLL